MGGCSIITYSVQQDPAPGTVLFFGILSADCPGSDVITSGELPQLEYAFVLQNLQICLMATREFNDSKRFDYLLSILSVRQCESHIITSSK